MSLKQTKNTKFVAAQMRKRRLKHVVKTFFLRREDVFMKRRLQNAFFAQLGDTHVQILVRLRDIIFESPSKLI